MQEAGPMNFLRTIAIILLIYYAFKFFARLFAPYLMKKMMNKMQEKAQNQYNNQQQTREEKVKEGETIIDKAPKSSTGSKTVGEYVDYEEIE